MLNQLLHTVLIRSRLIVTFICLSFFAVGQESDVVFKELDTAITYPSLKSKLSIVASSPHENHIRILQSGQLIDFWETDDSFSGEVLDFIQVADTNIYHYSITEIPADLSKFALNKYAKSGIPGFLKDSVKPDCDAIAFDCFGASIESRWEDIYRETSYFCPWIQEDSLNYIDSVVSFLKYLDATDFLEQTADALFDTIPGGQFYTRNNFMYIYKRTPEQLEAWEKDKPRREYVDSVSKYIDPYIMEEIQKTDSSKVQYCDYSVFYVKYKKNGKFDWIKVAQQSKYKIYEDGYFWFEERREIRKCKRYVRKSVRKIDLSRFDLKYDVVREFTFINDELIIN